MIHWIPLVKANPKAEIGANYVKNIDLDQLRNILICRMKSG